MTRKTRQNLGKAAKIAENTLEKRQVPGFTEWICQGWGDSAKGVDDQAGGGDGGCGGAELLANIA